MAAVAGFDWDSGNRQKCKKHGVTVREIEDLFRGNVSVAPSPKHASAEDRYIAVGRTRAGRALFVAFTLRDGNAQRLVRPISARYMHRKEIEAYEKASTKAEKR